MTTVSFSVVGIPVQQGSKNVVTRPNGTRWVAEAGGKEGQARHKSWRADLADAAAAVAPPEPFGGPVTVVLEFRFLPTTGDPYRTYHVASPDIDKLARSCLDALKVGRVVVDDSRVCRLQATKRYCEVGEMPGVDVTAVQIAGIEAACRTAKKDAAKAARKAAAS